MSDLVTHLDNLDDHSQSAYNSAVQLLTVKNEGVESP